MNVKLIADITILSGNSILLVRYKDNNKYDLQSGWFLPDDSISEFEHPDKAVLRILKEQLGIENQNVKLDHIESFKGNDKSWHLVFHYKLQLDKEILIAPDENIEKFEWFDLNNLPVEKEIAHHGWAKYTIEKMLRV